MRVVVDTPTGATLSSVEDVFVFFAAGRAAAAADPIAEGAS